jgi:FAD/FMN-containing dehydrogenase
MIPGVVIPGNSQTVNIGGMRVSQAVIEATAKFVDTQPSDASMIAFHSIHGALAKGIPSVGSVFGTREDHHMMEIVGCTMNPAEADTAGKWADEFYARVKTAEGVLDGKLYPSMAPTAVWDLKKIYGENYEKLLALKREVDPKNVFKQTVPRLEP